MKPVVTPEEMARSDAAAIAAGTPGHVLMDRAGAAVAGAAVRMAGGAYGRRIEILCGTGNNGGDGFAAARHLHAMGAAPVIALCGDPGRMTPDAALHWSRLRGMGIPVRSSLSRSGTDVIVDALVGTGLRQPLRDAHATWVAAVNASGTKVLAVDIPSGVDGATGAVPGEAVRADATVTMAALKVGLVVGPGAALAGEIEVADIGIAVPLDEVAWHALDDDDDHHHLVPSRPRDAHKWSAGSVLVVAGSPGMTGAGVLTASTALQAGAGIVVLAVPAELVGHLESHPDLTEVMTAPHEAVPELLPRFSAVALGPGLRVGDTQRHLVEHVLEHASGTVVVDADGLNNITPATIAARRGSTVLTPHAGELARLAGATEASPLDQVPALAREWTAVLLLKGPTTLIAGPDGPCLLSWTGASDLATAGTGDVLTGIVAALAARGAEPVMAAALGARWHGLSGRGARRAGDVRDRLAEVVAR